MGFMREYRDGRRAIREFAAARGWAFTTSPEEHEAILERLHGEPFHPEPPEPSPYLVLGRRRHRLSQVMRGAHHGGAAVVFLYTAEQEILDDGFGRRGRELSTYWVAALVDLPVRVPRLQVAPHTTVRPPRPGIATADPRVDERFHVHTDDPTWASRATRELAPILLDGPHRAWRISGTSILTWEHVLTRPLGIPLGRVDEALDELTLIAARLLPPAPGDGPGAGPR
ncbi:hypothetical protein AB0L00_11610 [Actinoallomurus sp. NPDC052308]|uniref:hypothetical protein n=1 Tax=Actinoallomurus sp. NPDC052308 TaxID=3155530 RepID=UPI00341FA1AC